jgi:hypothetical protein
MSSMIEPVTQSSAASSASPAASAPASPAASPSGNRLGRRLFRVAVAGYGAFALGVVVTGALNPGYSHVREAMSALAATDAKYAGIMIAGFLCLAISLMATGAAVWRRFAGPAGRPGRIAGRVAAVMIAATGVLMVVAGLARQDCSEQLRSCVDYDEGIGASTHFWVHQYASLAGFLILQTALFLLPRALRGAPGLNRLAVPARIVAFASLVAVVPMFVFGFEGYHGLVQRPTYALMFGWPILVAGLRRRF